MNPAPPIAMISDPTRSFVPGTTPRTVVVAVAMAKPSSLVVQAACTDQERRRVPHGASYWGTPYALDAQVPRRLFGDHPYLGPRKVRGTPVERQHSPTLVNGESAVRAGAHRQRC